MMCVKEKDYDIEKNFANEKSKLLILIGNLQAFINAYTAFIGSELKCYYAYEIYVEHESLKHSFLCSNVVCPFKKIMNFYVYKEYSKIIGSCVVKSSKQTIDCLYPDKLYVYSFCFEKLSDLYCVTMIHCPELLTINDVTIDGKTINDISFFYTNPMRIMNTNLFNAKLLYKHTFLRKELNRLILGQFSELENIIRLFSPINLHSGDIIINNDLYDTKDVIRLVRFNYDLKSFRAFIRAWYFGQLNQCDDDNYATQVAYNWIIKSL